MIFDPRDPFPLVDLAQIPYEDQKAHAAQVDEWLGFKIEEVESRLEREARPEHRELSREQWIGLAPQSLQTPYVELRRMIELIRASLSSGPQTDASSPMIVDLGAAYGRMGFVLARHWPEARFLGLELSSARVDEGNRVLAQHRIAQAELRMTDVVTAPVPEADLYFMYDFGSLRSIQALLEKLRAAARVRPVTVIGRGRATRDEVERKHPWLAEIHEPEHYGNFTIYRS